MLAARVEQWAKDYERKGIQAGRQEGIQIGEKRGVQIGVQRGEATILTRLLQRRFGHLPDWATAKISNATSFDLEEWSLRFVDAGSLEEIFAE